jgi:uncharacterized membrane protein YgcG
VADVRAYLYAPQQIDGVVAEGVMRRWAGPVGAVGVGIVLMSMPIPAYAEDPVDIETQITDQVDALGERRGEVEAALQELDADHQLQLFVVYVDSFSGMNSQDWAAETANRNSMGLNDAVLAVATDEREFGISFDPDYPLSDEQLAEVVTTAIEPALRENDWAGAAIGAAQGYAAVLDGEPVPEPEITPGEADPSAGGVPWVPVAAVAGVGAVGAYAFARARRRRRAEATGGDAAAPGQPSLEELDARASRLLVTTDDAVKTSEQELGFATAQFGEQAAAPFAAALQAAKEQLTASFRIRQQLDDAYPEDETARRTMLTEIITRCEDANKRLDAEADAFDRLRDLEKNAPQVIAEIEQQVAAAAARLEQSQGTVQALGSRYAESALAAVATNPRQANELLESARRSLGAARQDLAVADASGAAVSVLAAEEAAAQAAQLLDAVDRLGADLDQAAAGVQAAITEATQDLAEAKALMSGGQGPADLAGQIAAAEAALAAVQQEMATGRYDPLAAIRRVQEAGGSLDQALAAVRDRQQQAQRARASLEQALLAARSEISATHDFITTRRGGVGGEARTRLVEAQRQYDQAMALAQSDPVAALGHAQHADALAEQAGQLARADVGSFSQGAGMGGGLGGGSGGGLGGLVLGGILIDSMLGGRGGGGFGGGFGGSGGRGGGLGPGSFGGRGTRGRRGGGGKF